MSAAPSADSLLSNSLLPAIKEFLGNDCHANVDTPVLQLGLNSFQMLGLLEHVAKTLKLELPVSFSFDFPTLRKMASRLHELQKSHQVCGYTQATNVSARQ
mmetsp:Transcript_14331/g.46769  ORF Transcript_14331/g.46769 Transcript_14331/m.46769 type:complete len:101 (+) Transcript_14331:113-415(+)